MEIRMRPECEPPALFHGCWKCNAPLVWRLAVAGSENLHHELWRCTTCEAVTRTGWRPPCWINATQRVWMELSNALDEAVEVAYRYDD